MKTKLDPDTAKVILGRLLALNVDSVDDTVKSQDLIDFVEKIIKELPKRDWIKELRPKVKSN